MTDRYIVLMLVKGSWEGSEEPSIFETEEEAVEHAKGLARDSHYDAQEDATEYGIYKLTARARGSHTVKVVHEK